MKRKFLSLFLAFAMLAVFVPVLHAAEVEAATLTPVYQTEYNGNVYYFYDTKLTWEDAQSYCESFGGNLVTFSDMDELEFVGEVAYNIYSEIDNRADYWLGVNPDNFDEWITGEKIFSDEFFEFGEPSAAAKYIYTRGNGKSWGNLLGQHELYFICEIEQSISVLLDGVELSFDRPPIMINDRTMVPIRAIFEAMGYTVNWYSSTQIATALRGSDSITVRIGNKYIMYCINNTEGTYECDTVPQIVNDRILVPVRAIAEITGCSVDWNEDTQTVIITTNQNDTATTETTDNYNYRKILDRDFSDFSGTWINGRGNTIILLENGVDMAGVDDGWPIDSYGAYYLSYNDDGSYSWVMGRDHGDDSFPTVCYTLRLYPIGVGVKSWNGDDVASDTSQVRICIWPSNIGANDSLSEDAVYYKQ